MRQRRTGFQNRSNNSDKETKNILERNPSTVQFWVTICVLIVTIYFSNKSLVATQSAVTISKDQFDIAKEQWDSTISENRKNERLAKIKDNRDSIKYSKDTSRVAKRDKFQIESFIKQLEVYKQQLSAIRIQATIAKKQFDYQTVLNKQQLYINRPIFMLIKVEYDTVKKWLYFM